MNTTKTTYDIKFWLTLVSQILFFFAIFIVLSEWRASDMRETGTQVRSFTSQTLSGTRVTFPDKSNSQNTLIYFFAPWCTICHFSISNLDYVHQQFGDEINILIVALDYESVTEVEKFITDKALNYPVILGDTNWAQEYNISAFPSYYIVDSMGTVLSRTLGYSSTAGMLSRLAWVGVD